jgi:arsenate reductase-like glutaredoxin family protein
MTITIHTMPRCSSCEKVKRIAKELKIKFEERKLNPNNRELVTKIRTTKTPGTFNELGGVAPILESTNKAWPAYKLITQEQIEETLILAAADEVPKENKKSKLKIRRIFNRNNGDRILMRGEDEARINVTILRALNGTNIIKIMDEWSNEEKAAGLIMWRIAQHNKSEELEILADMIKTKASISDPFKRKNNTWIGDI